MNFQELADITVQKLFKYNDLLDWKILKKSGDAVISCKPSPDQDGNLYKLECTLDAHPETVFDHVFPHQNMSFRLSWDSNLELLEKIEEISKDVFITRTYVKGGLMGLISGREFVDLTKITRQNGVICFTAHSITHKKCPLENSAYIRAFNYPCGIFCFSIPDEPHKTHLVKFIQADLGGKIPHSLVHAALPSNLLNFYNNLAKALERHRKNLGVKKNMELDSNHPSSFNTQTQKA